MPGKPLAALSVDLDDLWSYLKTAGDARWREHPSFLSIAMPRLFEHLSRHDMGITAFTIGEDVQRSSVRPWLAEFVRSGHELASHSFSHNAAVAYGSRAAIEAELAAVEQVLEAEFGVRPVGYRGPSFSYSPDLLQVLAERGYRYDASTFPTFLGPLARFYHSIASRKQQTEAAGSDQLFGSWHEGFRPLKPYHWRLENNQLMELPTTTMPLLRAPMHGTYLHFLADVSEAVALSYFRLALALCRWRGVSPVFLLHASDFLGKDDLADTSVIPGMRRNAEQKLAFMQKVFDLLTRYYRVVNMLELSDSLKAERLPLETPPQVS